MKTLMMLLAASLLFVSALVVADTYQLTAGWTDPTTYLVSDTPLYETKYRVDGGAETTLPTMAAPGISASVTATPGAMIEVSVRAENQGLYSPWTAWIAATAPFPATQPSGQTGLTITITYMGP